MSLMDTPRGNRLHIGIFGKRNSGKSSLINALTHQNIALVSDIPGTTTDPVYKTMEIHGIGPCIFIDTAGFDDEGYLGELRNKKTREMADKIDIALILFTDSNLEEEIKWIELFKEKNIPFIPIINKIDILDLSSLYTAVQNITGTSPMPVSAKENLGLENIPAMIISKLPDDYEMKSITGDLAKPGDLVLLVMPQDIQAPKGRLILPQVQTLRDLLDKKCLTMSCTTDCLEQTLASLNRAPDLIITDSQVFKTVYDKKPPRSKLTSFSVLFAAYKGDIDVYRKGAKAIASLTPNSSVLIAECCTHAPLSEDIGREKIPNMLRKRIGKDLTISVVGGNNFPEDLSKYNLIIQCGACMFNRKHVLSRINQALIQGVPITNYGIAIAYLQGILDHINYS